MTDATTPSAETSAATAERNRLYWHSRRGMWELDLLLVPFLDTCDNQLSDQLKADYQRLIKEEDQDLFLWLMGRAPAADPSLQTIVQQISEHAQQGSLDQSKGL